MPNSQEARRYSDEEFAVILRTASEAPDASPPTLSPASKDGLTLSQIKEIAKEVGIDPDKVARAAALLPPVQPTALEKLLGEGPRFRVDDQIEGVVPKTDFGRVIQVARATAGVPGETREVLGGVEWTGSTGTTGYGVSVTPTAGQTHIQVWVNHTETMAGIYGGVGMGVMGVTALTLAKLVFGESDAGIIASILTGLPSGFIVARTVWKGVVKKYRHRLHRMLDTISREAEDAAEMPADLGGGEPWDDEESATGGET